MDEPKSTPMTLADVVIERAGRPARPGTDLAVLLATQDRDLEKMIRITALAGTVELVVRGIAAETEEGERLDHPYREVATFLGKLIKETVEELEKGLPPDQAEEYARGCRITVGGGAR